MSNVIVVDTGSDRPMQVSRRDIALILASGIAPGIADMLVVDEKAMQDVLTAEVIRKARDMARRMQVTDLENFWMAFDEKVSRDILILQCTTAPEGASGLTARRKRKGRGHHKAGRWGRASV